MGELGAKGRISLCARFVALGACGLLLANCSGGTSSKVDPKYGVTASPRVVGPGEPVPKGGGVYRVGRPYVIAGRTYVPAENPSYSAVGMASWYGDDFHGRYTANGEVFDMESITAAHPTLPLPSYVRVTNLQNRKSIVVRVNDRGPFHADRVIDLSKNTAKLLGLHGHGVARVKVDYVGRAPLEGSDDRKLMATLREGVPASPPVMVAEARPTVRSALPVAIEAEPAPAPVRVASSKNYAPAFFDARPMTEVAAPAARPQRLGDGVRQVPTVVVQGPIAEPVARPRAVQTASALPPPQAMPSVSPVSAYAPVQAQPAGFMSGRGLY